MRFWESFWEFGPTTHSRLCPVASGKIIWRQYHVVQNIAEMRAKIMGVAIGSCVWNGCSGWCLDVLPCNRQGAMKQGDASYIYLTYQVN
ncbi:hypothetical protein VTL71DRAFT_11737 [Oculimacula yallundae]|uniref:Uncharacterized protein n=1 Tax=Oculimacula yallundae TaxID=86028 RepID=A0ABR4CTI4_9HELO